MESISAVNSLMFGVGVLLLLGIVSSKFSARLGMPVLVLFMVVGMLAGSEGPGGINFGNYNVANSLASVALAMILFDGGLRTSMESVRMTWRPALSLATLGVLITSLVTGLAAAWILGLPLLHGMLLGSIVGSTDAAAVFSVLRTSGIKLPQRLSATLEIESASNDPMAIFLTIGLIEVIMGSVGSVGSLLLLFATQFGVGTLVGVGIGLLGARVVDRINLGYAGLYPVLVTAFGVLTFGLAAVLGGSGFLAVYLAGIALGNSNIVFQRGILLFHDAVAWIGQMALFVMLGLLSFPSQLLSVAGQGLLIALALIVVARPAAVLISALPFGFNAREFTFVSWVGLKGAVPITLATFPLLAGIEEGALIFNVVFFVVLVSAISQGWSLPIVARWLKLAEPADPEPPLSVEIHALRHVSGHIVEYTVQPSARVAGQELRNLALPDGVVMTLVVRDDEVIMPRGATQLRPGDHVFVGMQSRLVPIVDRLFDPMAATDPLPDGITLDFHRKTTVGQLHRFFGIPGKTWSEQPLDDIVESDAPSQLGPFSLEMNVDDPDFVTLTYAPNAVPEPDH